MKLSDEGGKASLTPGWVSQDIASPLAPIIVNGVVFAGASGQYHPPAGTKASAADIAKKSTGAVLYALDGTTGKQLWSSGKTMTSFSTAPIWAGGGQVYTATYDNTVYAFGFSMERYPTP